MSYTLFLYEYISWHYGLGIKEFLRAWLNIHWFWGHFFSMSVLAQSFFKPFHRMRESYGRAFEPAKIFETLIVNMMMRVVGVMIRSVFLAAGILVEGATFILGTALFVLFLLSPIMIPVGIFLAVFLTIG